MQARRSRNWHWPSTPPNVSTLEEGAVQTQKLWVVSSTHLTQGFDNTATRCNSTGEKEIATNGGIERRRVIERREQSAWPFECFWYGKYGPPLSVVVDITLVLIRSHILFRNTKISIPQKYVEYHLFSSHHLLKPYTWPEKTILPYICYNKYILSYYLFPSTCWPEQHL